MNRHQRLKQEAMARTMGGSADELRAGARWSQRQDPEDERFILVEFRMARLKTTDFKVEGIPAMERIISFCHAVMSGVNSERKRGVS